MQKSVTGTAPSWHLPSRRLTRRLKAPAEASPASARRGTIRGLRVTALHDPIGKPSRQHPAPVGWARPDVGGSIKQMRHIRPRGSAGPLAAPAGAAIGPCISQLAADPAGPTQTLAVLFATLSGSGIAFASILLFTPIILNIIRHRTGEGISLTTFWMQLIGFSAVFLYNHSKEFPFAAYGENVSLALQSLVILVLAKHFSKKGITMGFCLGLLAYGTWVTSYLAGWIPTSVEFGMQVLAMTIITGAIVPQIILNFKRKDTGEWSILTAIMSTGGNALRIFTTMQLTQDPLLLTGYLLGFAVNATLLLQIIAYRRPAAASEGANVSEVA